MIRASLGVLLLWLTACGNFGAEIGSSDLPTRPDALLNQLSSSALLKHTNRVPQVQTSNIRIASYNVENFFDDVSHDETYEDYADKSSNWLKDNMPAIKAQQILKALELAGFPDIVGLQEIESDGNQSRSLEILKSVLEKHGYAYFALGQQGNPVAVTTAVVSKFPILNNSNLELAGDDSSRDPQVATIDVNGHPLRFYVTHWKSMRGKDPADTEQVRMETAKLIKDDIEAARDTDPTLDIVLLGDFNSEYNQTQLYGAPSGIVEGLGLTGDARMMLGERTNRLYNLWFDLPLEARCATSFDGKRRCLDNVFVTDSLFDKKGLQIVPNSFRVVGHSEGADSKTLMNADGTPLRWQMIESGNKQTIHPGVGFSDHLPLVFEVRIAKEDDAKQKMVLSNPSTTEFGSKELNVDKTPVCEKDEKFLSDDELNFEENDLVFKCVKISGENLKIQKLGKHEVYVNFSGHKLVLSMTKSFGQNKDYLRGTVQKSDGKKLRFIKGRIGWAAGELAVFADSKDDIQFGK